MLQGRNWAILMVLNSASDDQLLLLVAVGGYGPIDVHRWIHVGLLEGDRLSATCACHLA